MDGPPKRWKRWLRIFAGGAAWAAAYNSVWGIAWFVFMRLEWLEATVASGRPMPWTPDFLVVWLPLTLPFGVAITAYMTSGSRQAAALRAALAASLVIWVPGTVGMAVWAWQEALSPRVIAIDSAVNLFALVVASLVLGLGLGARRLRSASPVR